MKPTKEHLRKKKRNLVLTAILLAIQVILLFLSVYFLGGEVSIYGNIAFTFFILGIPNLLFISTNMIMLYRGEWVSLRFALDKIRFIDEPQEFLERTFPTVPIVLLLLASGITRYFFL